jgi:hypothetical protein
MHLHVDRVSVERLSCDEI